MSQPPHSASETTSPRSSLNTDILAQRTRALAQAPPQMQTAQQTVLVVQVQAEALALPLDTVFAVYPVEQITPVPRTPAFVCGIFSARGRILTLIDLAICLGLTAQTPSAENHIIEVKPAGQAMGLLVESVLDTIEIGFDDLTPPLPTPGRDVGTFSLGTMANGTPVLDLPRLLDRDEFYIHQHATYHQPGASA